MRLLAGLLVGIATLTPVPAVAVTLHVTYRGSVVDGYNEFDDTAFSGIPYALRFVYKTTRGTATSGPDFSLIEGGFSLGTSSPLASILLFGPRTSAPVKYADLVVRRTGLATSIKSSADYFERINKIDGGYLEVYSISQFVQSALGGIPLDIDGPFNYTMQSGDVGLGGFSYSFVDTDTQERYRDTGEYPRIYATLLPYSVSVTQGIGGIPEPSTWALLVVGFGLTGAAIRRRDREIGSTKSSGTLITTGCA